METQPLHEAENRTSAKKEKNAPAFRSVFPSRVLPNEKTGSRIPVQAQLETTAPGDSLEMEADALSDLVMRKIDGEAEGTASPPPSKRTAISAFGGSSVAIPSQMESRLFSSLGSGSSLSGSLRSQMEQGFGRSLPDVRIHTGPDASELSSSIGARAFTYGNDIYFNQGQYQPGTNQGKRLIAHELTHTLQQSGKVSREYYFTNAFDNPDVQTEWEKRKEEILNIQNKYKIPKYLGYIIEYLYDFNGITIDSKLACCYYHAVLEHSAFKRSNFAQNIKLIYGRSNDMYSDIPPDVFFNDNPELGTAKWHYLVINEKASKMPKMKTHSESARVKEQFMDVIRLNRKDRNMAPAIRDIEEQYLWFRIDRLSQAYQSIDTSKLIGSEVWTAGLVFMLTTPFLAAGAISSAVIAASGSTAFNGLALAMDSKKAKVLIGITKNALSTAYSMATASTEDKIDPNFYEDQIIDCCVNIVLDVLFDYFGSEITETAKDLAWNGIRLAFKTVWGMIRDGGVSMDQLAAALATGLSTALTKSGIPALSGVDVAASFFSGGVISSLLSVLMGGSDNLSSDQEGGVHLSEYQKLQTGFLNYTMLLMSVS